MNWNISKQFDLCYGHRVWSQELNVEYSLSDCLMCRHLHGHQGRIIVHLKSSKLKNGMVTDFQHLNWFKKFIDDVLDHKFIIDINDPLFKTLLPHYKNENSLIDMPENFKMFNMSIIENESIHIKEMYEGFVIVNFVPTSENISSWLLKIVQNKMSKISIEVSHIEFYETPKSRSIVYP